MLLRKVAESKGQHDRFRIIAAMSKDGVIGVHGILPWHLPEDRKLFQQLTNQSLLILGRRTFAEDPKMKHINHARHCIVVSNSLTDLDSYRNYCPHTTLDLAPSFPDALMLATRIRQQSKLQHDDSSQDNDDGDLNCWIAGGEQLYREALLHESAFQLHLSVVDLEIDLQYHDKDDIAMFPSQDLWGDLFEKVVDIPYAPQGPCPGFSYHVYQKKDQI
jgi:dihydrofolate reductase